MHGGSGVVPRLQEELRASGRDATEDETALIASHVAAAGFNLRCRSSGQWLHVQVADVAGVGLDEALARRHLAAHQHRSDRIRQGVAHEARATSAATDWLGRGSLRFNRIVSHNPPLRIDFLSYHARGIPPRHDDPFTRRVWDGVSVYDSEQRARRVARQYPMLGGYIAMLDVPVPSAIRSERTGSRPGHWTLWGDPDELQRLVLSVSSVEGVE